MNVNFLKRFLAYLIDIILVGTIMGIISAIFTTKNATVLSNQFLELNEQVINTKLDFGIYYSRVADITLSLDRENFMINIINCVIIILYFVVLPLYKNGQTLGKKIMKLRVVSNNEKKLNFWKYLIRIVILNNIWLSLINVGAVYVVSGVKFYYVTYVISMLSSLIYMLNLIMVMFRKDNRGLHDMVAGTKVIEVSNDVVVESVEEVKKDGIKEKVDKVSKKKSSK